MVEAEVVLAGVAISLLKREPESVKSGKRAYTSRTSAISTAVDVLRTCCGVAEFGGGISLDRSAVSDVCMKAPLLFTLAC